VNQTKNTIRLLRIPFSVFLLPVSLFSLFFIEFQPAWQVVLMLIIWHLLVFPASNGYNSYNDQDEGPISGIESPPKPTTQLLGVVNLMDSFAIILSFGISDLFAFFIILYIFASRLYSYRNIRLKQYPTGSFLLVFFFQGAWIFCANVIALPPSPNLNPASFIFGALACSFLIGTMYPITQIYQHESDERDGIRTLSMALGHKATFAFSAIMFNFTALFIFLAFSSMNATGYFWIFTAFMLPAFGYFFYWARQSFRHPSHINFRNTMTMLVLSSFLCNLFFLVALMQ
jgi:1,4-dihydroxy-2-naphthoate polyprenyltransferase